MWGAGYRMSYSYDRRPSTRSASVSRPSAHGDPVKEAISNGWDALEEFIKLAGSIGFSMSDLQEEPVDGRIEKAG